MSAEEVRRLVKRFEDDANFRKEVRERKRAAIAGDYDLTESELAEFDRIDWSMSDAQIIAIHTASNPSKPS